ncbi:MAG: cyclic nucleotide-binding domain-containing protein [Ignavibacteria bacterium]|nr:cyclic nucleotide-binding domain-containing protein [Ignavibacteria bacterium]
MVSIIEFIGHISYIIFAFGTGFRNIIYLRTSLIIASVLQIFYTVYSINDIFKTPIIWSIAIIVINLFQVAYILYYKRFMNLSHDEKEVLNMIGGSLDIINFKKLMNAGIWTTYRENHKLIVENETTEKLFYLVDGDVEVTIKDKQIAIINKGNFLGEMSFLSGELPSASVSTINTAKILSWDKSKLKNLMEKNDGFKHEIYSIFSNDLIVKIINQNKQSILRTVIN